MEEQYVAEELSYIAFVARKFCNICGAGWDEYVVDNALDLFQRRSDIIECASNYDLYKSTETMQTKIIKFELDSEKFWLLLLFLKDYTESCFGEYFIFDSMSMADNLEKMMTILDSWNCELTISNETESAHIDAMFIREELKELLKTLPQKTTINCYPCIGRGKDDVLWHKVAFFMEMLDYFLINSTSVYMEKTSGRKDWKFIAQILYIVGYLKDEKYLVGYEETELVRKDLDGGTTVKLLRTPVTGVGKYIKDNTKCCKATPNRSKSYYCYNPWLNLID